jgi:hypothetical protein
MQIRRRGQRIHGLIRKMVGQDLAEAVAKLFPVDTPGFVAGSRGHKFELRVARGAEPDNFNHHAFARFLSETHDAADQALVRAPQVQQRRIALGAHFVPGALKAREPFPVLVHFRRAGGG